MSNGGKVVLAVLVTVGGVVWARKHFSGEAGAVNPAAQERPVSAVGEPQSASRPDAAGTGSSGTAESTTSGDPPPTFKLLAELKGMLHKGVGKLTPEEHAKVRVEQLMAAWKLGGTSTNDAAQAAVCLYARGVRFIPNTQEVVDAAAGFDKFRKEKGLFNSQIESYSVGEATPRTDQRPYTAVVVTINGSVYQVGVPDRNPAYKETEIEAETPLFWVF